MGRWAGTAMRSRRLHYIGMLKCDAKGSETALTFLFHASTQCGIRSDVIFCEQICLSYFPCFFFGPQCFVDNHFSASSQTASMASNIGCIVLCTWLTLHILWHITIGGLSCLCYIPHFFYRTNKFLAFHYFFYGSKQFVDSHGYATLLTYSMAPDSL